MDNRDKNNAGWESRKLPTGDANNLLCLVILTYAEYH